jgi:hypothetical protein
MKIGIVRPEAGRCEPSAIRRGSGKGDTATSKTSSQWRATSAATISVGADEDD